jgi:hypothetical protein
MSSRSNRILRIVPYSSQVGTQDVTRVFDASETQTMIVLLCLGGLDVP